MQAATSKVKASYVKRLIEVFADRVDDLEASDYPEVKERLGWKQSTYKTALRFLGKDTGNLRDGHRTYLPTDRDIEALRTAFAGTGLLTILMLTGCRWQELWSMEIEDNLLWVYSQKGSAITHLDLDGLSTGTRAEILYWVNYVSKGLNRWKARRIWSYAKCLGMDSRCTPHTFRHRAVTLLVEGGKTVKEAGERVGHRRETTTRRYLHRKVAQEAEKLLLS